MGTHRKCLKTWSKSCLKSLYKLHWYFHWVKSNALTISTYNAPSFFLPPLPPEIWRNLKSEVRWNLISTFYYILENVLSFLGKVFQLPVPFGSHRIKYSITYRVKIMIKLTFITKYSNFYLNNKYLNFRTQHQINTVEVKRDFIST